MSYFERFQLVLSRRKKEGKKSTHIIIKFQNIRILKILKASKEITTFIFQGRKTKLVSDIS